MAGTNNLFDHLNTLPSPEEYPTNIGTKSLEFLKTSFAASSTFTIITGYSALDFLISFFSQFDLAKKQYICVVLGNEPLYRELNKKKTFTNLSQEIKDYWLEQNISANFCWPVLQLIEHIEKGLVSFKILDGLHAKIYIGEEDAMLGSSNFSRSGLTVQKEANVRVERATKPDAYMAFQAISQYYQTQAIDANESILRLLKQLLQLVTWKEALARAVGEVLEGDSIRHDPRVSELFHNLQPPLWPVQEEAIGQAMYVLDNFGSVLIADPTGSGKTKVGAALQLCIKNRVALSGGKPNDDNTLLISPPQVMENWQQEFVEMGSAFLNIISQGTLSHKKAGEKKHLATRVQNARNIILDEAHNYLSSKSNRSEQLYFNLADHLILLTATPINKQLEDIFRLIEIMGIDNLDDEAIKQYELLRKKAKRAKNLSEKDRELLGSYLSQFLVRRTKKELNRRVDEHPEGHRLPSGRLCRFPKQKPSIYSLHESEDDTTIAAEINDLAEKLRGIIRLRNIRLRPEERANEETEQRAIQTRLTSAKALTVYLIQALLRSSGAALIEHIEGTVAACRHLENKGLSMRGLKSDKETGNMISKLEDYQNALPDFDRMMPLPDWLTDQNLYQKACLEEIDIYRKMAELARRLSLKREEEKADFIHNLLDKHDLVLGFDRNVITLNLIHKILKKNHPSSEVLVVTGAEKANQAKLKDQFSLKSNAKRCIGLCSEVMSEGVNLQRASAVVMLDLPGVLRIAEQRIGRIDRMNSPHDSVEIYFPDDHPAFALKTDRKFFFTVRVVEGLIGGNVDVPDEMWEKWKVDTISGKEIAEQYAKAQDEAAQSFTDGIQDAFQPLREMVSGEDSLIEPELYQEIRRSKATLLSLVKTGASFVASDRNWGFFCLRSSAEHSSVWVLIEELPSQKLIPDYKISRSLPEICSRLRSLLSGVEDISDLGEIKKIQRQVDRLFSALRQNEIESLPNKKKRAIHLLKDLITHYKSKEKRMPGLDELHKTLSPSSDDDMAYDYYHLSRQWIKLIQPYIMEERKRMKQRSGHIVHLGTMKKKFKQTPLPDYIFEELLQSRVLVNPIEKRIAAYIIGVKSEAS